MADPMRLAAESVTATPFEIPGARGQFRIQLLNEDTGRGVVTSIVHIPAGGFIPAHFHKAGPEMHYLLSGDLIEGGESLGPGTFLTQAPGVVHGPHESKAGAQVLTVQSWQSHDGQFDFNIAEGEASSGSDNRAQGPEDGAPKDTPADKPAAGTEAQAGAALAAEGAPARDQAATPEGRQATEQSLGRGYG